MIKVKICGMLDVHNVQEVSACGPDMLGYIFYPRSKRYVGTFPDQSIFDKAGKGILKTGVFVDEDSGTILSLANRYSLDLIQLHGHESATACQEIKSAGYYVIKAFGLDRDFDFNRLVPYRSVCDYYLFDTRSQHYGGTGQKFNWDLLKEYKINKPFILSGGIGPKDIDLIKTIHHPALYAVDINSRFEKEAGIKDIQKVNMFITQIKTHDA